MSGSELAELIVILAIFLGGVVLGVIVIVSMAIKREDRQCTLSGKAPDVVSRGARVLTGVASRDLDFTGRED